MSEAARLLVGRIVTMDPERQAAEALVVIGDRIAAVADTDADADAPDRLGDERGMLREGFVGDLVVLGVDRSGCSAEEFAAARRLGTEVGGRVVFKEQVEM